MFTKLREIDNSEKDCCSREIVRSRCFEYPAESLRSNLELKAVWDPVSGSLEIFDRTNFMDIKLLCLSPPSS